MRYKVIINDEEIRAAGDDPTFTENKDAVQELLRSGYFEVEEMSEYYRLS